MLFQDIQVTFFLKHLEGSSQGKTAELRSDASEITWKVKIDGRRLSDGWENFALAHDLQVGDIVVFRHEGKLVFHISALGPSCCEIQYGEDSDEEDRIGNLFNMFVILHFITTFRMSLRLLKSIQQRHFVKQRRFQERGRVQREKQILIPQTSLPLWPLSRL